MAMRYSAEEKAAVAALTRFLTVFSTQAITHLQFERQLGEMGNGDYQKMCNRFVRRMRKEVAKCRGR